MIQAILIVIVACLLGRGTLRALYRRPYQQELCGMDSLLMGGMVIIGLTEAAHLAVVVSGRSLSDCVTLFGAGLIVLLSVSVLLIVVGRCLEKRDKSVAREKTRRRLKQGADSYEHRTEIIILYLIFGIMVLIQLVSVVMQPQVYPASEMTVETVNSMLVSDRIYQVNPMTGESYTVGIPMRLKILCLPTLYAIICDMFGMSALQVVWSMVPGLVLLGSYGAFYTVAKALFPTKARKKAVFLIIVALILWVNQYAYGLDGFGLQYAGYRGVSIRLAVLLPYTFGLILRRKWRLIPLCILAEACIVWTLYGMGACLFVAAAFVVPGLVQRVLKKESGNKKQNGKEGKG